MFRSSHTLSSPIVYNALLTYLQSCAITRVSVCDLESNIYWYISISHFHLGIKLNGDIRFTLGYGTEKQ